MFFVADDGTHGSEVWVSDGTDPGTHMVKNINTSGSADPSCPIVAGGKVYFTATTGTGGYQLYVTDGTPTGTHQLSNAVGSHAYVSTVFSVNGHLFLQGQDAAHGDEPWIYNP